MAAKIVVRWLCGDALETAGVERLDEALASESEVWIDVEQPDREALESISRHVPLHEIAIGDALEPFLRPKIDLYRNLAYFTWIRPELMPDDGLEMHKLDVFLGERVLITSHKSHWVVVGQVAEDTVTGLKSGVEWVLHSVLDRVVDQIFPIADRLAETLEELEDLMLETPQREHLQRLYATKRLLLQLRRIVGPERDVLRGLARQEAFLSQDAYVYFQDIGDHLARVEDTVDTSRDVASGTMDIYLSSVSNRLNDIMKRLTIVSTIFLPLTVLTGIYGMNFRYLPELRWRYGYFDVLGAMVLIVVGMLVYFKRRDWW